jgi:hypothetical protein
MLTVFLKIILKSFVGMTGFEPATTRPPAVYANRTAPHPEFVKIIFKAKEVKNCHFSKFAQRKYFLKFKPNEYKKKPNPRFGFSNPFSFY